MKIVAPNKSIVLEFTTDTNLVINAPLVLGRKYVLSDGMVQYVLSSYGKDSLTIEEDLDKHPKRYRGQPLQDKSLLIIREGGAGDLLFTTPTIRHLKEKFPTCKIGLACSPVYHSLFQHNPLFEEISHHMLPIEIFNRYDYFVTFEGIVESDMNVAATSVNAYDLFAEKFSVDFNTVTNKLPSVIVDEDTIAFWDSVLPTSLAMSKKIGFQMRASSPIRSLPPIINAEIIQKLVEEGYTVFLIDSKQQRIDVDKFIGKFGFNKGQVINTANFSDNFERMAGIISKMDLIIGPDSSGLHIAAAFDIPIIGLYGPFRSALRIAHYNNAVGIDVMPDKCGSGCFRHTYDLCNFAHNLGKTYAPCWDLLDTDIVIDEAVRLFGKIYNS